MIIPAQFIAALILVESGGNDQAVGDGGLAIGCLQITPAVISDVNERCNTPNFYKLKDRTSRAASEQILRRYLSRWATPERIGRQPTFRDMALIWNRGPLGWARKDPEANTYWTKVKKAMEGI